jgi:hypothetical protein
MTTDALAAWREANPQHTHSGVLGSPPACQVCDLWARGNALAAEVERLRDALADREGELDRVGEAHAMANQTNARLLPVVAAAQAYIERWQVCDAAHGQPEYDALVAAVDALKEAK